MFKIPTVTELVKDDQTAEFQFYRDGCLWYKVDDFEFPVNEKAGATFNRNEKAITLMRWIRKHIEWLRSAVDQET